MDARLPAATDDLSASLSDESNRMPERNSFLITDFARKRTKARRR
jgi:hypothetical protein